jgi:hypothetical protein
MDLEQLAGLAAPAGIALLAAVTGALRASAPRPDWLAASCGALLALAATLIALTSYDPDVRSFELVAGLLAAGLGLGFLPPYLFFLLGRALSERPLVLGLTWAAGAVPLWFYYGLGVLVILELVNCPPGSYECPI